jgi:hypothetical protein
MSDTRIDFGAPATLRKWPSVNNERVSTSLGARPYNLGACVVSIYAGSGCPLLGTPKQTPRFSFADGGVPPATSGGWAIRYRWMAPSAH